MTSRTWGNARGKAAIAAYFAFCLRRHHGIEASHLDPDLRLGAAWEGELATLLRMYPGSVHEERLSQEVFDRLNGHAAQSAARYVQRRQHEKFSAEGLTGVLRREAELGRPVLDTPGEDEVRNGELAAPFMNLPPRRGAAAE